MNSIFDFVIANMYQDNFELRLPGKSDWFFGKFLGLYKDSTEKYYDLLCIVDDSLDENIYLNIGDGKYKLKNIEEFELLIAKLDKMKILL